MQGGHISGLGSKCVFKGDGDATPNSYQKPHK